MNLKKLLPESSTFVQTMVLILIALWLVLNQLKNPPPTSSDSNFNGQNIPEEQAMRLVNKTAADVGVQLDHLNLQSAALEKQIQQLLVEGQFKQARTHLLEIAAEAVEQDDEKKLGDILLLLGGVAIDEQEINTAEMLLHEALEIAIRRGDTMAMGNSYQQLGRLNIKTRALARYAGEAYDKLWLARNEIFRGEFRDAQNNLQEVIEANLKIRRYGAAASALETMVDFHYRFSDNYQAEQAGIEAAKLYASSGQMSRSQRVLDKLRENGMTQDQQAALTKEILDLRQQQEDDAAYAAEARDMQMMYHYHLQNGDRQRAWDLRIKASETLAKTSDRSMFQRQAEVMAILYSSNFAMDRAKHYLNQAGNLFSGQGADEQAEQIAAMQALIY